MFRACPGYRLNSSALVEAHFDAGMPVEVHGIDEAHFRFLERHDQGMSARSIAEEIHAVQQAASGDSSAREDNFLSRRKVHCFVNPLGILDAHRCGTFQVLGFRNHQSRKYLPV
jgi:hypothetical protein